VTGGPGGSRMSLPFSRTHTLPNLPNCLQRVVDMLAATSFAWTPGSDITGSLTCTTQPQQAQRQRSKRRLLELLSPRSADDEGKGVGGGNTWLDCVAGGCMRVCGVCVCNRACRRLLLVDVIAASVPSITPRPLNHTFPVRVAITMWPWLCAPIYVCAPSSPGREEGG
jgi:hypothetical protein